MYSIILVDDEVSLRQSIEKLVDWEKYNFQLIGTAENGLDALQLMKEKDVPDVVITDIKMPVMNGIDLAKQLREDYPTIKIVFLSGYDEFQYAVEGIRLNVVSYLLKPISKNEIETCLSNLAEQLDEELSALNDVNRVSEEFHKNLQLMQTSFLNSLVTEDHFNISPNELDNFLKTHQLEPLKKNKLLFVSRFSSINDSKTTMYPQAEFQRFSFFRLVRDITGKYLESVVFMFSNYVISILTGTPEELDELKDVIAKDISDSVKKLLNEEVVIGVSEPYEAIFKTKHAYLRAISALDYANYEDNENIVHIADIEKTADQPQYIDSLDETNFLLALKTNDHKYVENVLNNFFKDVQNAKENRVSSLRTLLSIVFVNCMRALRETIGSVNNKYSENYHQLFERTQFGDLDVIHTQLLRFCRNTMNEIYENRTEQKNTLVTESVEYLEENFTNSEISLKSASDFLNVSSSYLSSIFKKETQKSFIDTLTELRMNKAKSLVLTTDKKMFEIASDCGYDDQHYFSYSFKKYFGVSPTQMRKESFEQVSNRR